MQTTDGSITEYHEDYSEENVLFTYDENEREEQRMNKETAWMVLRPKFIPVYPELIRNWLTLTEATVYGFIEFFLSNNERFYCSDEQLATLIGVGERTISSAVKTLKDRWMIEISHRIKAWGWKIRFIKLQKDNPMNRKICVMEMQNVRGIDNKIIDNKIINKEEEIKNLKQKLEVEYQLPPKVVELAITFDNYKAWPKIRKFEKGQLTRWVNKLKKDGLECEEWMIATLEKSIASWYQWTTPIKPREIKKKDDKPSTIQYH